MGRHRILRELASALSREPASLCHSPAQPCTLAAASLAAAQRGVYTQGPTPSPDASPTATTTHRHWPSPSVAHGLSAQCSSHSEGATEASPWPGQAVSSQPALIHSRPRWIATQVVCSMAASARHGLMGQASAPCSLSQRFPSLAARSLSSQAGPGPDSKATSAGKAGTGSADPQPETPSPLPSPADNTHSTATSGVKATAQKLAKQVIHPRLRKYLGFDDDDDDDQEDTPTTRTSDSKARTKAEKGSDDKSKESTDGSMSADEFLQFAQKMANWTLEDYRGFLEQQYLSRKPPPIRLPPVPLGHKDYDAFVDTKRVKYYQAKQHKAIIDVMTDEQREEVEQGEAHWTPALLSDIRTRSADMGMEYLEEEVRQCFQQYSFLKKRGRRLCMWAQGFDRGLPTAKETAKVEDAIRQLELRDWYTERLRDCVGKDQCTLHRIRGVAGDWSMCSHTALPYRWCCGGRPMRMAVANAYMRADEKGLTPDSYEFKQMMREVKVGDPKFRRRLEFGAWVKRALSARERRWGHHRYPDGQQKYLTEQRSPHYKSTLRRWKRGVRVSMVDAPMRAHMNPEGS